MKSNEYCRYVRTYSELEGLQKAHTSFYCAASVQDGIVLELRCKQGETERSGRVLLVRTEFVDAMRILRYLCENGVGLEQWLDVLDDQNLTYHPLETAKEGVLVPEYPGTECQICGYC